MIALLFSVMGQVAVQHCEVTHLVLSNPWHPFLLIAPLSVTAYISILEPQSTCSLVSRLTAPWLKLWLAIVYTCTHMQVYFHVCTVCKYTFMYVVKPIKTATKRGSKYSSFCVKLHQHPAQSMLHTTVWYGSFYLLPLLCSWCVCIWTGFVVSLQKRNCHYYWLFVTADSDEWTKVIKSGGECIY